MNIVHNRRFLFIHSVLYARHYRVLRSKKDSDGCPFASLPSFLLSSVPFCLLVGVIECVNFRDSGS